MGISVEGKGMDTRENRVKLGKRKRRGCGDKGGVVKGREERGEEPG